ncbi:MAG: hypothetical protein PHC84_02910 [Clostridia bacterium]|nr:hypothetical protein [Clostridia bacterium]
MKRLILPVILFLVIALSVTAGLLGFGNRPAPKTVTIPTVEELNLHEELKTSRFGLFYYEGNTARSVLEDDLVIDATKPMVITTHGMLADGGYSFDFGFGDRAIWQSAGYNCFIFRWSQFSDDMDAFSIEKKEWSGRSSKAMKFAYEDENGDRVDETVNIPNYSLAEIFGAYYNEFMTKYDIKSPEIRFMGHSMGGQLTMAIASYVKTMVDVGALSARYMFNRVTMLDPFLSSIANDVPIDWLDRTIGQDGSAGLVIEIAREYAAAGIPVEYICSGLADAMVNNTHRKALIANTVYIKVDSSYLVGDIFEVWADRHQVAVDWYNAAKSQYYYDDTVSVNFAAAASTPTVYALAQLGGNYLMRENITEEVSDDVIYSNKLAGGIIAGYAFYDENDNGLCDDSFLNMRGGIKVELYEGTSLVATAYTNRGGYYKFVLTEDYTGKDLNIKTCVTSAQKAVGEGNLLLTGNGINAEGESDVFSLSADKEIRIINIGIR